MPSASQKTMMRELTAAADRERTGAFDVAWDGGRASLFFIFGHANHVELERPNGEKLVGNDALAAIARELPDDFEVSPWRRAMVTDDTLRCTAEELKFMFRRDHAKQGGRAAARSKGAPDSDSESVVFPVGEDAVREDDQAAGELLAVDDQPAAGEPLAVDDQPATEEPPAAAAPITLDTFPELPSGTILFSDDAANVDGLERAVPHLPNSIIVLTAERARGVVVVVGGAVVDALHVDETGATSGEEAARAVFGARDGRLVAQAIEDTAVLEALPALWRPAPTPGTEPEVEPEAEAEPDPDAETAFAAEPEPEVVLVDVVSAEVTDAGDLLVEEMLVEVVEAEAPAESGADEWGLDVAPEGTPLASPHEPAIFSLPDLPEPPVHAAVAPPEVTAPPDGPPAVAAPEPPPLDLVQPVEVETEPVAPEGDAELAAPPDAEPATPGHDVEPVAAGDAALTGATTEFVPTRVEVDMDALRAELVGIAEVWLGDTDAAPVAAAIHAARPGVDDFVAAIQAIGSMEIAGHEHAVVRAMAREMHFRAAEVLCGV